VDGTENPTCLRLAENERDKFIVSYATGKAQNFGFVRMEGNVAIYRTIRKELSDKEFERLAKQEADKFLHPENYKTVSGLAANEKAELEAYRKKYGALKA